MAYTWYDRLLVLSQDEDGWLVGWAYLQPHYYMNAENTNEWWYDYR